MSDKKDKINKILQERYEIVKKKDIEVVGIFLQGSQNYNLDYENSDIDTKAIVLPSFNDFVINKKPVSTTLVLGNNEHIDLKDIRLMFDCFKKQNINFIEILFTKYKIINPKYEALIEPIFGNREMIAHYNNYAAVNCIAGMSMEKYKALEHPYPATVDKIEKFGYDPKQLHHILRLNEFIKRYINGELYSNCLITRTRDYLVDVKKGLYNLKEARYIAKSFDEETFKIKNKYLKNNKTVINKTVEIILNKVLFDVLKEYFKSQIME